MLTRINGRVALATDPLLESYAQALSDLGQLGVSSLDSSRWGELRRGLESIARGKFQRFSAGGRPTREGLRALVRVIHEPLGLCEIVDAISPVPKTEALMQRLRLLPREDAGRDAQTELYFASRFRPKVDWRFGDNTNPGEPDIIISDSCDQTRRYGIEVKRLKSPKKFDARIKEASKTLQRFGHPGVIAIDATVAAGLDGEIFGCTEDDLRDRLLRALEGEMHRQLRDVRRLTKDRPLAMALMLSVKAIALSPDRQWCSQETLLVEPILDNEDCNKLARNLTCLLQP